MRKTSAYLAFQYKYDGVSALEEYYCANTRGQVTFRGQLSRFKGTPVGSRPRSRTKVVTQRAADSSRRERSQPPITGNDMTARMAAVPWNLPVMRCCVERHKWVASVQSRPAAAWAATVLLELLRRRETAPARGDDPRQATEFRLLPPDASRRVDRRPGYQQDWPTSAPIHPSSA